MKQEGTSLEFCTTTMRLDKMYTIVSSHLADEDLTMFNIQAISIYLPIGGSPEIVDSTIISKPKDPGWPETDSLISELASKGIEKIPGTENNNFLRNAIETISNYSVLFELGNSEDTIAFLNNLKDQAIHDLLKTKIQEVSDAIKFGIDLRIEQQNN